MQRNRTRPSRGADTADEPTPAPDVVEASVKEHVVRLGPPLVEHQCRDCLGRPFGVAGTDDVDIPVIDK